MEREREIEFVDASRLAPPTALSPTGRRRFLAAVTGLATITAMAPAAFARNFIDKYDPDGPIARYPNPDVIELDKRFKYKLGNTPIVRLYRGTMWAEGPAWNTVGRYLIWSDIPNNEQLRWLEEDGHVSRRFRYPAYNSNGNFFDYQGRQVAMEHGTRRVARYELDGSYTILADKSPDGKGLNAPNDGAAHPDGWYLFTDPGYGGLMELRGRAAEVHEPAAGAEGGRVPHRCPGPDREGRRRALQAQRPVLLARLQARVHRRHRGVPLPPGQERHLGVRRRRNAAPERPDVREHGDERQDRLRRRHPVRRGRQRLGGHGMGRRRIRRRPCLRAGRRAHRPDPDAGDHLQHRVRRQQADRLFMTGSTSLYAVYVETRGANIGG